jgi:tetratricopeptide (TPR) repeat protein
MIESPSADFSRLIGPGALSGRKSARACGLEAAPFGPTIDDQLRWKQREFAVVRPRNERLESRPPGAFIARGWTMRAAGIDSRLVLSLILGMALGATSLRAQEPTEVPREARNRFDQARDLQKKGQFQDAINAYDKAIQSGMQAYPRAHLYRADSLRDLKDYEKAIAEYTKFIEDFGLENSCRY